MSSHVATGLHTPGGTIAGATVMSMGKYQFALRLENVSQVTINLICEGRAETWLAFHIGLNDHSSPVPFSPVMRSEINDSVQSLVLSVLERVLTAERQARSESWCLQHVQVLWHCPLVVD